MNSVYYKYIGPTENMIPLTLTSPYKHLTIFNYSSTDIIIYNENSELALVPANSNLTLLDVFSSLYYDGNINIKFKTIPLENLPVEIHIINYGR